MLTGDFFYIENIVQDNGLIKAGIQLNAEHGIYRGHFPGMPVVPGVCQVQIMKEVMCSFESGSFLLSETKVCKFINMMNPTDVSGLTCEINFEGLPEGDISFSGSLSDLNRTYLKIKGILRKENG
jgi:3-hydroxyacyl-[acyl-carrier-protein] dehydratase